jgi:hypothetical protein
MYNIIMKKCAQAGTNLDLKPYPGCWMSTPDNFLYMTLRQQIDRIRHSGQFSIAEMDPSPEMKLDIHYSADHNSDATLKFLDFASRYTHLGISAEKP